jgi:hypothetical protein
MADICIGPFVLFKDLHKQFLDETFSVDFRVLCRDVQGHIQMDQFLGFLLDSFLKVPDLIIMVMIKNSPLLPGSQ